MIVLMLNKIIYSGQESQNKFILSNFPDIIEQAKEFERSCAKIAAMIYPSSSGSIVEIKNNNLSLYNIDSLFQKQFRLKTMDEWSYQLFDEKVIGNKINYGLMNGKSLSGKTTLANKMGERLNPPYTVLNLKDIETKAAADLGSEEEPFQGKVPIETIEKKVVSVINEAKKSAIPPKFIFDGVIHEKESDYFKFLEQFGVPEFILVISADMDSIKKRWIEKQGDAEVKEVSDEALVELKKQSENNSATR